MCISINGVGFLRREKDESTIFSLLWAFFIFLITSYGLIIGKRERVIAEVAKDLNILRTGLGENDEKVDYEFFCNLSIHHNYSTRDANPFNRVLQPMHIHLEEVDVVKG
jgi:hypothetical protein